MRHEQSVQTEVENTSNAQKKDVPKQTKPDDAGSNWQFPVLMLIVGLGVLLLILKSLGVV